MITISQSTTHIDTLWAAQEFVAHYGARLRWVDLCGWVVWNDQRWIWDKEAKQVRAWAWCQVRQWQTDAVELHNQELHKLVFPKTKNIETLVNILVRTASDIPEIRCKLDVFDIHPLLLNCDNGTLDLATGAMLEPDPAHYLTRQTPIAYLPDTICPHWLKFLWETCDGDQSKIDLVQRAFGYSLTGMVKDKAFFFLYGPTNSGKSLLLNILRHLLGPDHAAEAQLGTFFTKKYQYGGPRDEIAELLTYRVVTASEAGKHDELNTSLIKQFVGSSDAIRARKLYAQSTEATPTGKLWLASNHAPRVEDSDDSFWDRLTVIECPNSWVMPDLAQPGQLVADTELEGRLLAELPGILAWAVRGCLWWQQGGLQRPQSVQAANAAYRADQDLIADFLEEHTMRDKDAKISIGALYTLYQQWFAHYYGHDERVRPLTKIMLTKELIAKGYTKDHDAAGWHWISMGVRLVAQTVAIERN